MTLMIRHLFLSLTGLVLAAFGAYAATNHYPSSGELAAWLNAMPTLGAMLAFGLSIAAVLVGVAMLVPLLWRLRWRQGGSAAFRSVNAHDRLPAPRPVPVRHDDEDDYEFEPEGDGGNGYGGHHGGIGGGYLDGHGDRGRGDGEYREFDDRRRGSASR